MTEIFICILKHILSGDKMQTVKIITDPDAFQLLADETRRKMIYLLRVKDMTEPDSGADGAYHAGDIPSYQEIEGCGYD
jgi:hypothetical protein